MTFLLPKTQRLSLDVLSIDDGAFILELVNSPGWLKYIGDRNIHSLQEAEEYLITGPLTSYQDHGFGLFRVGLKGSKQPIGICGLLKRDYLDYPDLGFALLPDFEGKGYGYESASAIVNWAQENKISEMLLAITAPENVRSQKLLERLGFGNTKLKDSPDGEVLVHYEFRLR